MQLFGEESREQQAEQLFRQDGDSALGGEIFAINVVDAAELRVGVHELVGHLDREAMPRTQRLDRRDRRGDRCVVIPRRRRERQNPELRPPRARCGDGELGEDQADGRNPRPGH